MSTPGKVLVVLLTLASLVWILMASSVAQINNVGSRKFAELNAQIEKLQADTVDAQRQVDALKDRISEEQVAMGLDRVTFLSQQAAMEKVRSDTLEMATRVKLLLADSEASVKTAQTARDQREAEKKAEIEAKAKAEAEVAELVKQHSQLTAELTKLSNEFRTTLESNKRLVDRLLKSGGRSARSASFLP